MALGDARTAGGRCPTPPAALINFAWSGGQIAGSAGGGRLAQATDQVVPMLVAAGLSGVTLIALSGRFVIRRWAGGRSRRRSSARRAEAWPPTAPRTGRVED